MKESLILVDQIFDLQEVITRATPGRPLSWNRKSITLDFLILNCLGLARITFRPGLRLWLQALALQLSTLRPLVSNSANRSNFSTVEGGFTRLPLPQGLGLTKHPRQQFQCGDPPTTTQGLLKKSQQQPTKTHNWTLQSILPNTVSKSLALP